MKILVGLLAAATFLTGCAVLGGDRYVVRSGQGSHGLDATAGLTFPRSDLAFGIVCRDIDEAPCIAIATRIEKVMASAGMEVASIEIDVPLDLVIMCGSGPVPGRVLCDQMPLEQWSRP
jgi:hypothetical protein